MGGEQNDTAAAEGPNLQYYKVPADLYHSGDQIEANIYLYYQGQYILFKSKGLKWTAEDDQKLASFEVQTLYMRFASSVEHHRFLDAQFKRLLSHPKATVQQKVQVLYEISDPVLSTIFKTPESAENIESAANYVKNCIRFLNEKGSIPEIVQLASKSFNEHSHGLQVSAYSVALAKESGYKSYEEIFGLGLGALLHDIGKSQIKEEILNKPAELDDDEWQLIRQHPQFGMDVLKNNTAVPDVAKRIVLEHHERVNGKGYPRGTKNIHIFSKIVGITDCFNALTSERPYGKRMEPYDALKFMLQSMSQEFDKKLMAKFIEMLSK